MADQKRFGILVTWAVDCYKRMRGMKLLDEVQQDIAREIGVSDETLRKWRGGQRLPKERQDLHRFVKLMYESGTGVDRAWILDIFEAAGIEMYVSQTLAELGLSQPPAPLPHAGPQPYPAFSASQSAEAPATALSESAAPRPSQPSPVTLPVFSDVRMYATTVHLTTSAEVTTPARAKRGKWMLILGLRLVAVVVVSVGLVILKGSHNMLAASVSPTNAPLSTPLAAEDTHGPAPAATKIVAATPINTIAPALPPTLTPSINLSAVNVSNNPGRSEYPMLAVDHTGRVHLIWSDASQRPSGDFFYRQANTSGDWQAAAQNLSGDFEYVSPFGRLVQAPDGQPCLVWLGSPVASALSRYGLYRRCLERDQWSAASRIADLKIGVERFQSALAPNGQMKSVYVQDGEIRSDDQTLTAPYRLIMNLAFAIDSAGGYHVAWIDAADLKSWVIVYRYSSDGGNTWTEPQTLSDQQSAPSLDLVMAADVQGRVHLAWDNVGVFYRRWSPHSGWEPTVELSGGGETAAGVQLALDATGLPHVIWQGSVMKPDIIYTHQQADGAWTTPQIIAHVAGADDAQLALAVSPQGVKYFAWQAGDRDIYYATLP